MLIDFEKDLFGLFKTGHVLEVNRNGYNFIEDDQLFVSPYGHVGVLK